MKESERCGAGEDGGGRRKGVGKECRDSEEIQYEKKKKKEGDHK